MLDSFRTIFGNVNVKETDQEIVISGVNAKDMIRDMDKVWKTTRLTVNMFNTVSSRGLSFYKYFAPEVMYMLENIKFYRSRWTSIKAINMVREELMDKTWLKNTVPIDANTVPGRLDFSKLNNLKFTPEQYQMDWFNSYNHRLNQYGLKGDLIAAAAGTGKAQPLTSMVKIPGGWKQMGNIRVGDMVTAWDGSPTQVTGVYPQGVKQTFQITFADDRVTEACAEHLWRVYCYDWTRTGDGWKILNSAELYGFMHMSSYSNRLYVQLCKPEDSADLDLPIDPYNLGVILGDGGISSNCVTVTSGDPQLFTEFAKGLPENLQLITRDSITVGVINKKGERNPYTSALRELDLLGSNSLTKSIPHDYLFGSLKQRLALVQGLMDTDGTVDVNSNTSFCTTSYVLAKQFQYLIRSLGGIAKLSMKEPSYTYNGAKQYGNMAYVVLIRFPTPSALFRLDRKLARCNDDHQYAAGLKLKIKSITVHDKVECQCIQVEHPDHLYVTDDFIVTHNTYMTCAVAEMLGAELIVVVIPRNVMETTWLPSIEEMYKEKQTVWHSMDLRPYKGERFIVCHYEQLNTLEAMLRDPDIYQGKKVVTILDESHYMNDPNSARSMAYQNVCRILRSDDNLLGSGTPVKALGSELITLMRVIDPMFTPAVEAKFRKMFGKEASKGLDIIRHRMGIISFKVAKSELKLQPPIMRAYPIKIPNGDRFTLPAIRKDMEQFIKERVEFYKKRRAEDVKFWDECVVALRKSIITKGQLTDFNEYLSWVDLIAKSPDPRYLGDEMKAANKYEKEVFERALPRDQIARFRDVKSVIKYTHLKIQGEVLGRVVGGKRIEAHVAMVPFIDWIGITESTEKKTVVFTSFVEVVEAVDAVGAKLGMKPIVAYGKTTGDLAGLVGSFEKNKQLNPLVATYASLSTGVRLTMADTMVLINSPFRGYILEQAIARIYRMGQDSQTYVYQCTLDTGEIPNISTRSADILQWSQEQVAAIMGITTVYEEGANYEIQVAAMEAEAQEREDFDDNAMFYRFLRKSFERFDIDISPADFEVPKRKPTVPAYMR